jgi:hypothetical protein
MTRNSWLSLNKSETRNYRLLSPNFLRKRKKSLSSKEMQAKRKSSPNAKLRNFKLCSSVRNLISRSVKMQNRLGNNLNRLTLTRYGHGLLTALNEWLNFLNYSHKEIEKTQSSMKWIRKLKVCSSNLVD